MQLVLQRPVVSARQLKASPPHQENPNHIRAALVVKVFLSLLPCPLTPLPPMPCPFTFPVNVVWMLVWQALRYSLLPLEHMQVLLVL